MSRLTNEFSQPLPDPQEAGIHEPGNLNAPSNRPELFPSIYDSQNLAQECKSIVCLLVAVFSDPNPPQAFFRTLPKQKSQSIEKLEKIENPLSASSSLPKVTLPKEEPRESIVRPAIEALRIESRAPVQ
jgi:hypothetical protein